MDRLKGRVVIITGAAHHIGQAYAVRAAEEGAKLVVADLKDCEETAALVRTAGAEVLPLHVDVSDEAQANDMAARTFERFGRIDCLVNNAAIYDGLSRQSFMDVDLGEWDRLFQVNVKGTFLCARAVFPFMKDQGSGKIINIGSSTILNGTTGFPHYVSSKAAVWGMTRSLAKELGQYGVTVNTLAPGYTNSGAELGMSDSAPPRNPRYRPLDREEVPADLTGTMVHLLSADSDFMTGQMMVVNGGDFLY